MKVYRVAALYSDYEDLSDETVCVVMDANMAKDIASILTAKQQIDEAAYIEFNERMNEYLYSRRLRYNERSGMDWSAWDDKHNKAKLEFIEKYGPAPELKYQNDTYFEVFEYEVVDTMPDIGMI